MPFIRAKILKRLAHYLGLGQGFCITHCTKREQILDAGFWILDLKGILFLIYPESSIQDPASLRFKQRDICTINLSF
jgi:hypothetical protein